MIDGVTSTISNAGNSRAGLFALGIPCAALWLLIGDSFVSAASYAADSAVSSNADAVDTGALVRDLTLNRQVGSRLTVTIWMPDDFWRTAFRNSGNISAQGVEQYLAVVHPYVLIAVLDAQRGITAFRFTDSETLSTQTTIEDSHGAVYSPLTPDAVGDEIRNLTQMMRPMLANMMGAMGQHMEFLVFANADSAGNPIADPKRSGSLTVHVGDASMRYRLPLGSVLPPSLDPKTRESFPGNYRYNPYTGDKLTQTPAPGSAPQRGSKIR